MKIAIVSNLAGKGLQVDAELLRDFLVELQHEVTLVQFDTPWPGGQFDLGISLEVVVQHFFSHIPRWWWIPNCEWLRPEYTRPAQRGFEKILAKTRDAEKILRTLFNNVEYVGFLAKDRLDSTIPRIDRCLHIGGDSGLRGTNEVISAWREYRYYDDRPLPELTIISKAKSVVFENTPGIVFHKYVTDNELKILQNSHRFHLAPANYEGFGHSLHESQSVGAVLLTTGAGPMAEVGAPFEVAATPGKSYNLGTLYEVSIPDLRDRLIEMVAQPPESVAKLSCEARARFIAGNEAFKTAFRALLEPQVASLSSGVTQGAQKPRIALLGNLRPEHSTENDLVWSLRDLGYPVTTFQEDEDTTETILRDCVAENVALLIYVHTHSWQAPGHMSLDDLWKELQASHIRTCSFHLDLYWGLNQNDGREDRIGQHAFFRTERIFTADGGHQKEFLERLGTDRHVWLPPAICKREATPGEYTASLAADVGFVGADSYHPEHSFRGRLIEFLRSVYGSRFRLYQGYRGKVLRDVYASVKVLVGDSCGVGARRYWSDRYPETAGRGGFLITPQSEGLMIPGIVHFEPGNLHDLQDKIDWYLEHEEARLACQKAAWLWVRENETYSNRMTSLLSQMGIR